MDTPLPPAVISFVPTLKVTVPKYCTGSEKVTLYLVDVTFSVDTTVGATLSSVSIVVSNFATSSFAVVLIAPAAILTS